MSSQSETSELKRKDLDFEPIRETWGMFKLPEGIIVRARIVLIRCWELEDGGQGQIETSMEMAAIAPESVRQELLGQQSEPENVVRTYRPNDWKVERPAESSYHVSNNTVLNLLAVPVEMKRFNRPSKTGEPVIQVGWQADVTSRKIG